MKLKFLKPLCALVLCALAFASCQENKYNISSMSQTETSSSQSFNYGEQTIADNLIAELNEREVTQLNFYYVKGTSAAYNGYKPLADFKRYGKLDFFKQIKGADQINSFKASLEAESWRAADMPNKSVPVMTLYFGNFFILNLEEKQAGDCYVSIYTEEERAYYLVPSQIYDSILNLYTE